MSGPVESLVYVAGNTTLDVLVRDVTAWQGRAADAWAGNVQLLPQPIDPSLGGGGAAAAYLLGRLGQPVVLNTNLGTDGWGRLLHAWLSEAQVDIGDPPAAATAVNVILLTPEGKRQALYYTGEKVRWQRSLVEPAPAWFLASGYGKVEAEDAESLQQVFTEWRQRGTRILFDPSPWFNGRIAREAMQALWAAVNVLVATEEELAFWQPAATLEELATRVLACGPDSVVIKRGGDGAFYGSQGGEHGRVSVPRVDNANTVGAGDTFNGRLLYGLCREETLSTAVAAATHLATAVVKRGRGVLGIVPNRLPLSEWQQR